MDDLMPYDSDRLLPAAGIIYFFYAGSDYDSESDNASYWRVLWIEETNELENAVNIAKDAINKYGVLHGGLLGAWRILRCNPLSKGGHDPVK